MVHRREEFDALGHHVVIQQVREDSKADAWIDGRIVYSGVLFDNLSALPPSIADIVEEQLRSGNRWRAIEVIVSLMLENDIYFCRQCKSFYSYTDYVSVGFSGHMCKKCDDERSECDEGGTHDWTLSNRSQRHNARVRNKYRCEKCGETRKDTASG